MSPVPGGEVVTASPAPQARFDHQDAPDVSFITVTYGTGPIVIDTLASLAASLAATNVTAECLVVDNAHPHAADRARRELLLGTAGVRVLSPGRNLGFGGGCELGALHARGAVLAFVNPDLVYPERWLEPLLEALERPEVSIAAPVLLEPDGTIQEAGQTLDDHGDTRPITDPPPSGTFREVTYSSAAVWLIRRDEHERLGGFDPTYHPAYYEDVDLALRAAALGGRCVVHGSSSVVHHRGTGTASTALADVTRQRSELLAKWPTIKWRRPQL